MSKRTQMNFTPTKELRELIEAQAEMEGSPFADVIRRRLLMGFGLLPVEHKTQKQEEAKQNGSN